MGELETRRAEMRRRVSYGGCAEPMRFGVHLPAQRAHDPCTCVLDLGVLRVLVERAIRLALRGRRDQRRGRI